MSLDMKMPLIESDLILAAIPGRKPGGTDLRYSGVYEAIREARRSDDPRLPQGIWQRDIKKANFKEVERLAQEALSQKGKDLQVMAWLIEAWYELYGLKGLEKGLASMKILIENFWETGFPALLKKDPTARLSPFMWLNEKFSQNLNSIPIAKPLLGEEEGFTFGDWKFLSIATGSQGSLEDKEMRSQALMKAVDQTPWDFYEQLRAEASECKAQMTQVESIITLRLKDTVPPLARLKRQLSELEQAIEKIGAQRGERMKQGNIKEARDGKDAHQTQGFLGTQEPVALIEKGGESLKKESGRLPTSGCFLAEAPSKGIQSRSQAYALLESVERYFAQTEPQNPALCLLKRILAWKDASLEAIIAEVVKEQGDISSLKTALGIHNVSDPEEN